MNKQGHVLSKLGAAPHFAKLILIAGAFSILNRCQWSPKTNTTMPSKPTTNAAIAGISFTFLCHWSHHVALLSIIWVSRPLCGSRNAAELFQPFWESTALLDDESNQRGLSRSQVALFLSCCIGRVTVATHPFRLCSVEHSWQLTIEEHESESTTSRKQDAWAAKSQTNASHWPWGFPALGVSLPKVATLRPRDNPPSAAAESLGGWVLAPQPDAPGRSAANATESHSSTPQSPRNLWSNMFELRNDKDQKGSIKRLEFIYVLLIF